MRVLFLTIDQLEQRDGRYFSSSASSRWAAIYPQQWLGERGHDTRIVSIGGESEDGVRAAAREADRVFLGKLVRFPGESEPFEHQVGLYLRLLSERPRRSAVMIVGDDVFDLPQFRRFIAEGGDRMLAWFAASDEIAARLAALSDRPVIVVPECYELSHHEARVPRYGFGRQAARAWARFTRGSGDASRLRLLWFGHPSNMIGLRNALADLDAFGRSVPLHLHCVTSPGFGMEELAKRPGIAAARSPLHLSFEPWTLESCDRALLECELVIIPHDMDDPTKLVKSNNRLVAALRAGRLAIANPIPSFRSMQDFAWVGEPLSAGIRWALDNPQQALERVAAGQQYVESHHSPRAIADHWERFLTLAQD